VEGSPLKMSAADALQIGILLSQQENEFGTNMYESLKPADEEELLKLVNSGMSSHEAALQIFRKKFLYKVSKSDLTESGYPDDGANNGLAPLRVSGFIIDLSFLTFSFLSFL
jgi:hypothetical protein